MELGRPGGRHMFKAPRPERVVPSAMRTADVHSLGSSPVIMETIYALDQSPGRQTLQKLTRMCVIN
jgi:hypothetical protein